LPPSSAAHRHAYVGLNCWRFTPVVVQLVAVCPPGTGGRTSPPAAICHMPGGRLPPRHEAPGRGPCAGRQGAGSALVTCFRRPAARRPEVVRRSRVHWGGGLFSWFSALLQRWRLRRCLVRLRRQSARYSKRRIQMASATEPPGVWHVAVRLPRYAVRDPPHATFCRQGASRSAALIYRA